MSLKLKLSELCQAHSRCSECYGGFFGDMQQWGADDVIVFGLKVLPLKEEAE